MSPAGGGTRIRVGRGGLLSLIWKALTTRDEWLGTNSPPRTKNAYLFEGVSLKRVVNREIVTWGKLY